MQNITERIMKSLLGEPAMHKHPADSKQPVEEKVPGNWMLPLQKRKKTNKTPKKLKHRLNLVCVENQSQIDERALVSVAQKMESWKIKSEEKRGLKPVISSRRTSGLPKYTARKAALLKWPQSGHKSRVSLAASQQEKSFSDKTHVIIVAEKTHWALEQGAGSTNVWSTDWRRKASAVYQALMRNFRPTFLQNRWLRLSRCTSLWRSANGFVDPGCSHSSFLAKT